MVKMENLEINSLKEKNFCPICGGNSRIIDNVKTINSDSFDILNLRECFKCRHWWIEPMPDQDYLIKLYKESSGFVVSKGYAGSDSLSRKDFGKKYLTLLNYFKNKKYKELNYLEIGCGSGYLLNYFNEILNTCVGIEPGGWKPEGSNIYNTIDDIPDGLKFDIIIAKDVIEHLENPMEMMKKLSSLANSDAIINLSFPNKDCPIAKFFVGQWAMIRPVGHLHYFSAKSVNKLLKSSGWSIVKKKNYWPADSFLCLLKSFDWHFKNPLKLIYRVFVRLFFKQIIMGKDQWHIIGMKG